MTDQEIIELNDLANIATTKSQLGPFWEMFERMAGGEFVTQPGNADRRRTLEDWKVPVFAQRQCIAPTLGSPLAGSYSTLEYLSVIAGCGEALLPFAIDQLGDDVVSQLRIMETAPQSSILSRVVAALALLDRPLADDQITRGDKTFDAITSGSHHCNAATHRFAQLHLSELIISYPVLICNRIVVSPNNYRAGALVPIAHGIACSRNAQFPRESHGGSILTRDAIRAFASRPLTRIAMTQNAHSSYKNLGYDVPMQGLSAASAAFDTKRVTLAARSGLLASMIENSAAGGHKFPLGMLTGSNTGAAASKLFPVLSVAMARAIMQSAGLITGAVHETVRYGNLNPEAPTDATGLLGTLGAHGKLNLIDERFQNLLWAELMSRAEHFIVNRRAGGALDDRISAFVNAIVDSGITRPSLAPPALTPATAGVHEKSARDTIAQSAAKALLEFSFSPPPGVSAVHLAATSPDSHISANEPLVQFGNADPSFAQQFIEAFGTFGITSQDIRDQMAWCEHPSADGWRQAIDIAETRNAMKEAIATAIATATAVAISSTAEVAVAPESRRARVALRL